MADKFSKEQRSRNMRSIRSVSELEGKITAELWRRGFRFRRNVRSLFGTPDIAIKKYKVVIFIDSCFWHGCPLHGNIPKTNVSYWENKINRNKKRDEAVTRHYKEKRWHVLRIWEHDIKRDFEGTVAKIGEVIAHAKASAGAP